MVFHEGKEKVVAAANSHNVASGGNIDSAGAKLFIVAVYICVILKKDGKEDMPKVRPRSLYYKPWKSVRGL